LQGIQGMNRPQQMLRVNDVVMKGEKASQPR